MKYLLSLLLAVLSFTAFSQDKIYTMNGQVLNVKIKEVNPRTVRYTNTGSTAEIVMNRRDIDKIVFENGTEEIISNGRARRIPGDNTNTTTRKRMNYGNNILSLALVQMTDRGVAGIGVHYERMLDKNQRFAFYLPVAVTMIRNDHYNYYTSTPTNQTDNSLFVYFYPGLKIYPGGSARMVSYAVGPSLAVGTGSRYVYSQGTDLSGNPIEIRTSQSGTIAGLMVNNSLNIMPSQNLYLGLEFGIGFKYYDSFNNDQYSDIETPLVQFNFKLGYRF